MTLRAPLLDAIAYPMHVGYVPLRLFIANMLVSGAIAVISRNLAGGAGIFFAVALFAVVHVFVAIRFRRDPFVEKVWLQFVMPPDHTKAGARRLLRVRTPNLRREAGRKYTV